MPAFLVAKRCSQKLTLSHDLACFFSPYMCTTLVYMSLNTGLSTCTCSHTYTCNCTALKELCWSNCWLCVFLFYNYAVSSPKRNPPGSPSSMQPEVSVKAGSQYDAGSANVAGKSIFSNSIPDVKFSDNLIGWTLTNADEVMAKLNLSQLQQRSWHYAGTSVILWTHLNFVECFVTVIHNFL